MSERLYWLTGLSGAGKTTIGSMLFHDLKKSMSNVVLFDGDALRNAFGNDLGYSRDDRFQCAMRYSRICKLLTEQDIRVICCTISMFDEVRNWNRDNIEKYTEIYIEVPMEELKRRNQKDLYSGAAAGDTDNVVGINLDLELPKNPDIILKNDGVRNAEQIYEELIEKLKDLG